MTKFKIAVIPGDRIGKEVVPKAIRVLEAAGSRFGIAFDWDELSTFARCGYDRRNAAACLLPISSQPFE